MTLRGCVRLWQSSQDKDRPPREGEGRHHCLTCPVGAERAGATPAAAVASAAARELEMICARCDRPASRLINGRHCVSCYNRDREAAKGKNAKGNRPLLCDALHAETLAVHADGAVHVRRVDRVVSRPEAMILVARAAARPLAFAPTPPPALPRSLCPVPHRRPGRRQLSMAALWAS